jgi:GT2 family glycosyltransferase
MSHSVVAGISVVIPNYNGRYLLEQILPPLLVALKDSQLPHEIIVSDDRSTDESVAYLQTSFPTIRVLINERNLGFGPTINKGIFVAQHTHLLLLNSDVKLTPGYFSGLLVYFDKDDTFGVMSQITGWDNDTIQDGRKYPSFHGMKIKTSGNYIPVGEGNHPWLYSMYLSGANAFVDRQKMVQLGGFDELFAPFYVEDYELSIRAWRFGWKCYYDHDTICRHKESVTIKTKARKHYVNKIYYRNKMYLHALHLPPNLLALWHLQLLLECLLNVLLLRFYFVRAIFQYLRHLPAVYARRKAFNNLALRSGKKLLSLSQVTKLVLANISGVETRKLK